MGNLAFILTCVASLLSIKAYVKKDSAKAVWALAAAALLVRLGVSMLDPFLHDWDEKFHALVAKNMMTYPLQPMLRVHPILPYDFTAWCCNHIWLHKQPLFMWQMALSMKVFGINEVAIRIPSALLSAAMVWCIYRIAFIWTGQFNTAYIAALLSAFSWFQIELVSGGMSLDHNDIVYTAYITGSIWAFCEYSRTRSKKWAIAVGCTMGCAILVKWLTALVVLGGWGLWIVLQKEYRFNWKMYRDWLLAALAATVIALPWQLYIMYQFPKESAYEYRYNVMHMTERLGAFTDESWAYHFTQWAEQYGNILLIFGVLGISWLCSSARKNRPLTWAMLAMVTVVYTFFSFLVQTKMPAFVYMVCAVPLILVSIGINRILEFLDRLSLGKRHVHVPVLVFLALYSLRPLDLWLDRDARDPDRVMKVDNTKIFKSFQQLPKDYLVFNCKSFEDVDMMFYTDYDAYSWCPSKSHLDSLLNNGYKIAIFQAHRGKELPDYVQNNPNVVFIQEEFK